MKGEGERHHASGCRQPYVMCYRGTESCAAHVWVPKVSWGCAAWLNFVLAGSDRLR